MQSDNWLKDNGIDFDLTIVTIFDCLALIVQLENCSLISRPLPVKTYAQHSWSLSKNSFFYYAKPTVTRACPWYWSSPKTLDTNTCSRAFGSGAVTTCLYDLGLSQSEIDPRSPACEAHALLLPHSCYILNGRVQIDLIQNSLY